MAFGKSLELKEFKEAFENKPIKFIHVNNGTPYIRPYEKPMSKSKRKKIKKLQEKLNK